jgi:Ran GTPase-activating protein (RanGAP) involved in mRNA processing and transport
VHTLRINQLLSHVDLAQVLGEFSHLSALHLTYGARKLGMDYDKALFGMNHADAMTLSKFVRRSDTLTTLRLVENVLNDESIQILMSGFQQNYTITSLDLSHNRIDDVGATRLAALLDKNRVMSSLKLYNNQIGPKGAEALGQALAHSNSLLHFDIALNPLGEKGGKFILEGAEFNKSLRSLSLAGCDLGPRCSQGLGTLLIRNKSLTYLDLTSNALPDEAAEVLTHAISKFNTTLLKLDCRRNDMALEATADFQRLLKSRFAAQKRIDRKAYQDGWDEAL